MIAILSPAKTIDIENANTRASYPFLVTPRFLDRSETIAANLRRLEPAELARVMKISVAKADEVRGWYLNWSVQAHEVDSNDPPTRADSGAGPAILAFRGETYRGFDASTILEERFPSVAQSIRILSTLYGILRPFDLIQNHRLDFTTKHGPPPGNATYYTFWRDTVTATLAADLHDSTGDRVVVNLSSTEFSRMIDRKSLASPILDVVFRERDANRVVSVFAKRARGMMARFLIDNDISSVRDIASFDADGYRFAPEASNDNTFVFVR